jgi:hypothetical protein
MATAAASPAMLAPINPVPAATIRDKNDRRASMKPVF